MSNHVYIATSLDGYIATADGGLEWLETAPDPEAGDFGFAAFMETVDALVMGRATYEKLLTFGVWPYEIPVFVMSRREVPIAAEQVGKAAWVAGGPEQVIQSLGERGYERLYIDGGRTIQGFLERDLIDTMTITRIPVVLGGGIPLFGLLDGPLDFQHEKTEVFDSGLVKSRYVRAR